LNDKLCEAIIHRVKEPFLLTGDSAKKFNFIEYEGIKLK